MLEAVGLTRRFGWRWALRGIDLALGRGGSLALLGPNGSGKTTLLKILAGLLRPSDGEVSLDGRPLAAGGRGRVGLLGHEALLYPSLTIRENLRFFGRLFGLPLPRAGERIAALAERLRLADRLDEPVRALSQGLRQRAAMARALLHEPEVILLDEPFSGLDPRAAGDLEALVRELCGGGDENRRIVVFTTHDLGRARSIAKEAAVLADGRVVLRAPAGEVSDEALLRAFQVSPGRVPPAPGGSR